MHDQQELAVEYANVLGLQYLSNFVLDKIGNLFGI